MAQYEFRFFADSLFKSLDAGSDACFSASYVHVLLERNIITVLLFGLFQIGPYGLLVFAMNKDRAFLYLENAV